MTTSAASLPQTLYRLFAADGTLLYIGISERLEFRLDDHSQQKDWWRKVDHYTVVRYPDRQAVKVAEAEAIRAERPMFNVVHNQDTTVERARARLGAVSDEAMRRGWTWELNLPEGCGVQLETPPAGWFKSIECHTLARMQLQADGYLAAMMVTRTGTPKTPALVNLAREALDLPPFDDAVGYIEHDGLWRHWLGAWNWIVIERRRVPALVGAFHQAGRASRLRIREVPDAFTCKHSKCMNDRSVQRLLEYLDARRRIAAGRS